MTGLAWFLAGFATALGLIGVGAAIGAARFHRISKLARRQP
jgi:hypothetical protein